MSAVLDEVERAIRGAAPALNAELRHDGTVDPVGAAYVEGHRDAWLAVRALYALDGERP